MPNILPPNFKFYNINGKNLPSVTSILSLGNEELLNVPLEILKFRAQVGTVIHNKISSFFIQKYNVKGTPQNIDFEITPQISSEVEQIMPVFFEFVEKYRVQPMEIEKLVWHTRMLYAGTIDFIGKIKDKLVIADWKTSGTFYSSFPLQVVAYKMALLTSPDFTKNIEGCMIVLLNKSGFRVGQVIDEKIAWEEFWNRFDFYQKAYRPESEWVSP